MTIPYTQLFLSRDICQLVPNPWERYLPRFKQLMETDTINTVSPSLAQRYFSKILEHIGTPAQNVRDAKPGTGRKEGDKQVKRQVHPTIFKNKKVKDKEKKGDQNNIQGFGKQQDTPKPQKIEEVIDTIKSWLSEIDISKTELIFALEKELPA